MRAPGAAAELEEIVIDPPGADEVLVRIVATGVCHSDLHTKLGNFGTEFPYLLGHEATAVVEALGPGVTHPAVGTRVILSWRSPCGACRFCAAGNPTYCATPLIAQPRLRTHDGKTLGRVLGLGTFATHTVVHAAQAIPVPVDLDPAAICLIGCGVATGVGAVLHAANVRAGATVALFGCGAVGLSVLQGARLAGASRIIAVDVVPRKLEWARAFGATDLVDAGAGDAVKQVRALCRTGVDYSFEAVGLPLTLSQALAVCDLGAVCTMIGVPAPKSEMALSLPRFFFGRGHLRATHYGDCLPSRDFPFLLDCYRRGVLDLDRLVTGRIGLHDAEAAFGALERGEALRSVMLP